MRNTLIWAGLACCFLVASGTTVGCAERKTEGERTLDEADRHAEAGVLIRRGELMVQDGTALESRGMTIRRQGDEVQGDQLIAEGRAKQAQGRELIEQGRKMRP